MAPERSPDTKKTLLPGFGLPLDHIPRDGDPDYINDLFPTALSIYDLEDGQVAQPMTTLRELTMLQIMNSITDKPDWHTKVYDETIAQKWKEEALASDRDVTQKMVDWCIDELRHNATFISPAPVTPPAPATPPAPVTPPDPASPLGLDTPPPIFVYNGDVFKSDYAISTELKRELQEAVIAFEKKIPPKFKDWHPGSDEKVWDLVHPSLFPLIYGSTRVLANGEKTTLDDCIRSCGKGEAAPVPPAEDLSEDVEVPFSSKFQWLPCEVDISGDEAKITTYINNLHPDEHQLYNIISKLIDASIPMWELTLAPLQAPSVREQRISYHNVNYDPDPEGAPETEGPQQEPDEDDNDYWERRNEWIKATRVVVRPEPEDEFEPLTMPPKLDLKECYGNRGLQVIVKLANIELTPEKPEYNGGSWHVEGQLNEHIVATSLYYYSSSNITTSTLAFRQQCNEEDTQDVCYPQNQHEWLSEVFGCEQDGFGVQILGDVVTREGRLLTFPNILQHRVGPFKLEDPTKPGHRKIVALFLVDPNIRIISTAHVPCQRRDWWWDLTRSLAAKDPNVKGVTDLPVELQDHIVDQLDGAEFPISIEEAKRLRLELMEERKGYGIRQGKAFEETYTFSLCEH